MCKIFLLASAILVLSLTACSRTVLRDHPLEDFIFHAAESGLPTGFLETIGSEIIIKQRSRPAYSRGVIFLTDSFDHEGAFKPYYLLDSFEVSSVFHEGFHAYADLATAAGSLSY